MPRIGITACSKLADYQEAVRRAGGDPVVVDPSHGVANILTRCDAIVLSGGGDVDPVRYGEVPHSTFVAAEPGRDEFEIDLARAASDADVPMLAICRGIQVLNVARGGSLVQDIPSQISNSRRHKLAEPPFEIAHDVAVTPGSLLHQLLGGPATCDVNSRHHQSVKEVGEGLVVTATAPDGVIEAVADPSRRFCLGVQWHPENFWRTGEFASLFRGLLDAAGRR
jgi:putative glutamine amidotransferase